MIKEWKIERDWQEPFLDTLRSRGASPQACDAALDEIDDACIRENKSARELFGDPRAHGKEYPVSVPMTVEARDRSRTLALALAVIGLVGMFFTLLGWIGHVKDAHTVWGANPMVWFVIGAIVTVGAAIADTVLGARADFTQNVTGGGARFLNRLLPWIIVALTLIGMLIAALRYN